MGVKAHLRSDEYSVHRGINNSSSWSLCLGIRDLRGSNHRQSSGNIWSGIQLCESLFRQKGVWLSVDCCWNSLCLSGNVGTIIPGGKCLSNQTHIVNYYPFELFLVFSKPAKRPLVPQSQSLRQLPQSAAMKVLPRNLKSKHTINSMPKKGKATWQDSAP